MASTAPAMEWARISGQMKSAYSFIVILALLMLPLAGAGEQADAAQVYTRSAAAASEDQASVIFLFEWEQGRPWISYSIKVQANGKAHFEGDPNAAEAGGGDPFQQDLMVSEANRQKIFDLAKKVNYFQGDFDYHKKIAQTGKKTLEYQSGAIHNSATYNWSQNPDLQSLTHIFQGVATTLDYGRKLAYQYRFDKLGMDARIRELEQLQQQGYIEELQAIEPILQKIADDPNLMRISRESAKHLLKSIGSPGATTTAAQPEASQL